MNAKKVEGKKTKSGVRYYKKVGLGKLHTYLFDNRIDAFAFSPISYANLMQNMCESRVIF